MKTKNFLVKGLLAVALGICALSPKAVANDQVAIQLGALQLGIDLTSNSTTDLQRAQALVQGRAVIRSSATRAQVGVQGFPINPATIQTDALRSQIRQATILALSSPVTSSFTQTVTLDNGRTSSVRATLNPRTTTASAIFGFATTRIPNFSPSLVTDAITGALSTSAPNTFVFNYKDESSMLKDINKLSADAMKKALKAYARGTVNWAGVPAAGVGNGTFLPNFSARPIQPRSSSPQAPDLSGLANAAAAVSGAAADALNANLGSLSSEAIRLSAMTNLATSLVKGAASFQRTSTTLGLDALVGGAVAGSGFGQVAMVADPVASHWGTQANLSIMNGIIAGGVKGSSANAYAFAWGVATGYAVVWAEQNNPDSDAFNAFRTASLPLIEAQLIANKVKTSGKFDQGGGVTPITLNNLLLNAFNTAFTAFQAQDYSNIAGGLGLQLPGTPTPVTDTVGL